MLGLTPPRICLQHTHLHHITHYIYKEQIMQQLQNIFICKWQMTHSWLFTYTSPVFGPWRSIYDSVVILSMNDTFTENKCCNTDRNKYNNIIVWNVYKKIIAIRAIKNLLHLLFQYLQCPKETKPNHICRRAEFSKHCTQLWYCIWSDSREAEKNVPPVRHSRFWNWVDSS